MAASIAGLLWKAVSLIRECRGGSGSRDLGCSSTATRKNLASADGYLDSRWVLSSHQSKYLWFWERSRPAQWTPKKYL